MFDKKEVIEIIANEEQYIQEFILVRPFEKTTEEVMNIIATKYPLLAEDIFEHDDEYILYRLEPTKNYRMYFNDFKNDIGSITPVCVDKVMVDMNIHHYCDYIEPETA